MLLATVLLLIWESDTLKVFVNIIPDLPAKQRLENDAIWTIAGIAMFLFTATYRVMYDAYNIFFWGGVCTLIGVITLIIGFRKRKNYV